VTALPPRSPRGGSAVTLAYGRRRRQRRDVTWPPRGGSAVTLPTVAAGGNAVMSPGRRGAAAPSRCLPSPQAAAPWC